MKKRSLGYWCVLGLCLLLMNSCRTPRLVFNGDFQGNTIEVPVKGRQGWQFNQVITFGNYKSSTIKRGWTRRISSDFIGHLENAKQKLSFTQFAQNGDSATVLAVGQLLSIDLPVFNGFFAYSVKYENLYAGSVVINDKVDKSWNFAINGLEYNMEQDINCGTIKNGQSQEITVRAVRQLDNQSKWEIHDHNYGFEFLQNGTIIGAVSIVDAGMVWMKNDLPEEIKLVLASVSTAILVKPNIVKES